MSATSILSTARNKYLILFFLVFLTGIIFASQKRDLFYPDEARIVYIARNINLHNMFILRFGPNKYYEKPPFYFWLIAPLSRLKLSVAKISLVVLNLFLALFLAGQSRAFFQPQAVSSSSEMLWLFFAMPLYFVMSLIIRMDMLFCLFLSLSLFSFYRAYEERRHALFLLSGFFAFLACFTKGGFGFFIPLVVAFGLSLYRRKAYLFKGFFLAFGFALALIIVWLFGFGLWDKGYWHHMLFQQTFKRAFAPTSHTGSFFAYGLFFLVAFFPLSLFLFLSFLPAPGRPLDDKEIFSWFWLGGGILVLSLTKSKNIMYLLSLSVPVVFLAFKAAKRHSKAAFYLSISLSFVLAIVFIVSGFYFRVHFASLLLPFGLAFVFLLVLALSFKRKQGAFYYFLSAWFLVLVSSSLFAMPKVSREHGLQQPAASFNAYLKRDKCPIYVNKDNLLAFSLYLKRKISLKESFSSCLRPFWVIARRKDNLPFVLLKKTRRFALYYAR